MTAPRPPAPDRPSFAARAARAAVAPRARRGLIVPWALTLALALALAPAGCDGCKDDADAPADESAKAPAPAPTRRLTLWWAQWAPAETLQELAREFGRAQGVDVRVQQVPWDGFQDRVWQELGKPETGFDVVLGDAQWLGRGATKGLYLELTDWLPAAVPLGTLHPKALAHLAEYPPGSRRYYAAPAVPGAVGFVYRKDWFDDTRERDAFRRKYRRELGAPQTWEELRDLAAFFHRPDDDRYGVALVTGRARDELVAGFTPVLHAFGGSWGDAQGARVKGHLDSPAAVQGLEFWKGLVALGPPGASKLGYGEALERFTSGKTALAMNDFAFFQGLAKDMGDRVGFFPVPKHGDRRFTTFGGHGFSISTRIPPERQELAKSFIAWFLTPEVQLRWAAKPGRFPVNAQVLASDGFRKATRWNGAFADSLDVVVDFPNVPVANELLAVTVQHLGEALDGTRSAREALAALADRQERILRQMAE